MALSVFEDKSHLPTSADLAGAMGPAASHWESLKNHLQKQYGPLAEEWNHAGAKFGWSFRLKDKKRVVAYMTPCRGHFLAGFVLGEKAVHVIRDSDLPSDVIAMVEGAKAYAEGRGVRLEIRTRADLECAKKLAAAKMIAK
jgi:hypothetical protein